MKLITVFTALSMLLLVTGCEPKKEKESTEIANDANDAAIKDRDDEKDADFIVKVVAANYAEVKLAQLALNRTSDARVKKIATMLQADHTKSITDLKGYAAKNGITIPLEESDDHKKDYNNLAEEKETKEFDEKWCDQLADNHEETINYFERRLDKTEDVDLKNWITATLPGLRSHLEMLRASEVGLKQ